MKSALLMLLVLFAVACSDPGAPPGFVENHSRDGGDADQDDAGDDPDAADDASANTNESDPDTDVEPVCVCDETGPCCDGCDALGVGDSCDDGRECTLGTTCQGDGSCGAAEASPCDELLTEPQCQAASCDDVAGCSFENIRQDLPCEAEGIQDGRCDAGECVGTACVCDEQSECCNGCAPINEGDPCDDGNFATANDSCQAGQCVGEPCECFEGLCCSDGCFLNEANTPCSVNPLEYVWFCPDDGNPRSTQRTYRYRVCDGVSQDCTDQSAWFEDPDSVDQCSVFECCGYQPPSSPSATCISCP